MSTLKSKEFWLKNEQKIVLVVAFCLISVISFEFGLFQGQKSLQKPLIIEKPADTQTGDKTANSANSEPQGAVQGAAVQASSAIPSKTGCAFVGSKNSTIFYIPTCAYAKRIKPENLVCYTSEADAISKGKTKKECK